MRYVRRPRGSRWSAQLEADVMHDTIMVDDAGPFIETGLLDTDGCPLARVKDPIGFRKED